MASTEDIKCTDVTFDVPCHYTVYFCRDLFSSGNSLLADFFAGQSSGSPHRCLVFVDQGLAEAHPGLKGAITAYFNQYSDIVGLVDEPEILPGGEACKNSFDVCHEVIRLARRARLCRHSYIIAVGGGAFLDAVGFGAALIHRGVRLARVPTTVLSQNDSGIGVKNGLNLNGAKNYLGTFSPPAAVFNDFNLLYTLPARDWIAGMAEAFKVGIIKDREFLQWLCGNTTRLQQRDDQAVQYLIRRCAELHAAHIANGGDPFESGSKRPLDFGHWAGHKLESLSFHELRHGEAVAIGMGIDLLYAADCGFIARHEAEAIIRAMVSVGLPAWDVTLEVKGADGRPAVLAGIDEFREHIGGTLTIPLPGPLGSKREITRISTPRVEECLNALFTIASTAGVKATEQASSDL